MLQYLVSLSEGAVIAEVADVQGVLSEDHSSLETQLSIVVDDVIFTRREKISTGAYIPVVRFVSRMVVWFKPERGAKVSTSPWMDWNSMLPWARSSVGPLLATRAKLLLLYGACRRASARDGRVEAVPVGP